MPPHLALVPQYRRGWQQPAPPVPHPARVRPSVAGAHASARMVAGCRMSPTGSVRSVVLLLAALAAAAVSVSLGGISDPLHGNSKSRVFHNSTCRYYNCPNCTVSFATPEEALRAGYRPCGICRPSRGTSPQSEGRAVGYVGNTRSRVFHRLSCRFATCASCRVAFKTREAAVAAGYRPGGCCNP